jgi:5-(carboxyamino)imidazole ribonucleotide synthase
MRVGIIGAGQLGRMLALAGYPLGIQTRFLDPNADGSGGQVGPVVVGVFDDAACIDELARQVDVVTFDIENVPVETLRAGTADSIVRPPPEALSIAQDRLNEKLLFERLGIPAAPYVPIASRSDLERIADTLGWPIVLKARRLGYDGRGQRLVHSAADLEAAWHDLGSVPSLAEGWVDFERELSLIAVRGSDGAMVFYPMAENVHVDGMLHTTTAPYQDERTQSSAQDYLASLLEQLDYCGVLTVEFFLADGELIANEIAPRVHNSGHWTIEGAQTSQFENHMRAIVGLPLGSTSPTGYSFMLNLIGELPDRERLLKIAGLHLHDYGKTPRPKRKIGHCTLVTATEKDRAASAEELLAVASAT